MSKNQNRQEPDINQDKPGPKRIPNFMKYSGMAFQMGVIIWIGTFLGQKADAHFQTERPYLAAVGAFLGLFVAFYLTFKDLLRNK